MGTVAGESPNDPDDIDRRLREIQAEIAGPAKYTEPSAAERASSPVTSSQRLGWRQARKARKLRQPVQPPPGPRRRRGRGGIQAVAVTIVVLGALSAVGYGLYHVAFHQQRAITADVTPVTSGPVPTFTATPVSLPSPTVADPFAGTPAASFGNGAAGIVPPPAHRVGDYTSAQVRTAYQMVKRMLTAAHLNGPTLRGRSPNAFARLLIPQQQAAFDSGLDKIGLTAKDYERSTRAWVTSFAPGSTAFVGNVIKVHGGMRASTGRAGVWHVLRVHANYLFVYPVMAPSQPASLMRIVVRDDVNVAFAAYTDPGGPLEPLWQLVTVFSAGGRCDVNDGFVHPAFPAGAPDTAQPTVTGPPIDPYNLNASPDTQGGCQAITGT